MKKQHTKISSTQWFIILWLGGFLTLLLIAGVFKILLFFM
ncbi:DUF2474 domain-containing protein [Acinetobacter haemolyticus]|nr:DUF2474 domain-containing protein [Acinetobacter haemolyticus]NCU24733.1 DUF2474 domain-containing protein [Acinetobacter haemolyticus]RSN77038.1 DUF2474 domain-containing protein [Acinetobacter haemolyticus]